MLLSISIPVFDKNNLMAMASKIIPKNFLSICNPFGPKSFSKKVVSRSARYTIIIFKERAIRIFLNSWS